VNGSDAFKMKVALSVLAVAALATPALAARSHQQVSHRLVYDAVRRGEVDTYPGGGAGRTGTAASPQSAPS
jgi:hypothetical protein